MAWERIEAAAPKQLLKGMARGRVYGILERIVTAPPEQLLQGVTRGRLYVTWERIVAAAPNSSYKASQEA